MVVAGEVQSHKRKRSFVLKYACIAVCFGGLVLLAFAFAHPLRQLFAKPAAVANATESKDKESNDSVPDGSLASKDGFAREPPHSQPTPPTATPTKAFQPLSTAPTAVATTATTTTKEPSVETTNVTGGSGRRRPRHFIAPSSSNHTNTTSGQQPRRHHGPASVKEDVSVKKVTLQVVYSCYCPRSRHFIVSQLLPVYEALRDRLNLTLLPSSQAKNDTAGNSTNLDAECKPGDKECHSSMIQTCVMTHANETLTAVKIIACMSSSDDPYGAGRACVEGYGVEWRIVELCVTEKGKLYLLELSQKVWRITGGVGHVPLVYVEGEKTRVVQVEAQTNLLEVLCDQMHHGHEACAGGRNGTALSTPDDAPGVYNSTAQPAKSADKSQEEDEATMGRP